MITEDYQQLLTLRAQYAALPTIAVRDWPQACELDSLENDLEQAIKRFIGGYKTCLLWSSNDGDHEGLEDFELAPETLVTIEANCRAFISANIDDLLLYAEKRDCQGYDEWECAGHDFWLTRCGHGVGFWDRGLDELGERLSAASKLAGAQNPYISDDGKVWL